MMNNRGELTALIRPKELFTYDGQLQALCEKQTDGKKQTVQGREQE